MQARVYWNLTKHCWSIQHHVPGKGWRLYRHAHLVSLKDCTPVVQEGGRQRVLREGKKYVHAFLQGEVSEHHLRRGFRLTYRPSGPGYFQYKESPLRSGGKRFDGARLVTLDNHGIVLSSS